MSLKEQLGDVVLVIAGADSLVGESLLEQLAGLGVPVDRVIPLVSGDEGGARLEFGSTRVKSVGVEQHVFSADQVLIVLPNVAFAGADLVGRATGQGAHVLGWKAEYSAGWPLVAWSRLAGQSDHNAGTSLAYQVVSPVTAQLLRVVDHVRALGEISRVTVHAMLAVSEKGKAGVTELAAQTARILNVQDFDSSHFSKQIAFNVIPDDLSDQIQAELACLLDVDVNVSAAYVPVFFGHTVNLRIEMHEAVQASEIRAVLEADPVIDLLEPEEGALTPVAEAASQDQVLIGGLQVRSERKDNNVVTMWSCADNVRVGTALSGIQALGFLVQKRFD